LSYKIAFKKSVGHDLKKIDRAQTDRILKKIEEALPEKADQFPVLTGNFAGLRKFRVEGVALILRISHRRESYR